MLLLAEMKTEGQLIFIDDYHCSVHWTMSKLGQYSLLLQTLISNTDQCELQFFRINSFALLVVSYCGRLLVNVAIKRVVRWLCSWENPIFPQTSRVIILQWHRIFSDMQVFWRDFQFQILANVSWDYISSFALNRKWNTKLVSRS